jgi:hypothetical protein
MSTFCSPKKIISILVFLPTVFFLLENCSEDTSNNKPVVAAPIQDTHIGELMGRMQYNFVKLGLALQHRNQRLANFYIDEVNEVYDDIASKNITNNGKDISLLITQILKSKKDNLKTVIAANDTAQFDAAYHAVVVSCNNCHLETNHDFIVIEEPHGDFNGQDFGSQHSEFSE